MTTSNQNYVGHQSSQALNPGTSGMAIASFVLGLLGLCFGPTAILGLVFGLVALHQIKKSEGLLGGRGFALAGTILSTICIMISILAVVAIPIMRGQIDVAKWKEGKAIMETVSVAISAYAAESRPDGKLPADNDFRALGFRPGDLDGTYFTEDVIKFSVSSLDPLKYTISATNYDLDPPHMTLNQDGKWAEEP